MMPYFNSNINFNSFPFQAPGEKEEFDTVFT